MAEQHDKKLHIAVFPWLAFGHIVPYFELAKFIAQKGHRVSFISTPRNIQRLPKLPANLQPLVNFIELPLPHVEKLPEYAEATMDLPEHLVPYLKKAFDGLEEPLTKFLERSKPDWIIHDFAPYWLHSICSNLGIFCCFFSIFSAFGISFGLDYIKSHPEASKTVTGGVFPGQNESGVSDIFRLQETLRGAQVFAPRSCVEIEGESLKSLESNCMKPVIPVGLLPPSLDFSEESSDENWDTIVNWLDKQEKKSVIYVAFGSEVTLSNEDFNELAMGLELSGFPYFWVLKKQNSDSAESSQDWIESHSSKRGMVWRTWAPQMRILTHKSIGGFLTHCGWSSVIEALQVGCPLIMLPFHNEQMLVARFMEGKKLGVKVSKDENGGNFTRDSVAKALRSVMLEEEGKAYRSQAEEMSKIVGDKRLHQNYVDEFVDYMEIHRPAIKD